VTIALAIAVLVLAVALVYLLVARQADPVEQPDLAPAIQEAAHEATSRALTDLLKVGEAERKRDTEAAEAALSKREAEFRRLTAPIDENLKRIEREVATLSRERKAADGAMQSLLKMDIDALLPQIKAPIEAINADIAPTDETRIKKTLPTFKLIVVPKTGHFLMMEAADRFNPILIQEVDALANRT